MQHNNPKLPRQPHDKFFKAVFSIADHAAEMLKAQVPESLRRALPFDSLRVTTGSFVDEQLSAHFADIVVECTVQHAEQPAIVSLVLEHKSYVPPFAPFQLLRYQMNGWKQQLLMEKPRPTPIIVVLFYHGDEPWPDKSWPEYLHGFNPAFDPFTPSGGYLLVDLSQLSDERIMDFQSGFLKNALLLMKHRKDRAYLLHNLPTIFNFVEQDNTNKHAQQEYLKYALNYLRSLKTISLDDIKSKLQYMENSTFVWDVLADERAEGREEGREEEREILIRKFIVFVI